MTRQVPAAASIGRAAPQPRRPSTARPGLAPRPRMMYVCAALVGIGFGAVVGTGFTAETHSTLTAPGGLYSALGRIAGLAGAYLLLVMVLLIARLPWLERAVGQDLLITWHRIVAPWAFVFICAHVIFITLGAADAARVGVLSQLWVFITIYPDMLMAIAGTCLLIMVGVASYRLVRTRLRYETWWVVHLYTYLGVALAFAHQITGASFVGHPLTRTLWILIWAATAGTVLVFRVVQPIWRSLRHQLRVVDIREEAPRVFSVILRGRKLDRLPVAGGQFFHWRFLTRGMWWQAHPYSLSALPKPPYVRITIKGLGDQGRAIRHLRPGTRVAIEGPYGAFTHHARISDHVLLIGAGVGVTPLRALLEDLSPATDVVVIIRASTPGDLVLHDEIAALVTRCRGRLHEVLGSRQQVPVDSRLLRDLVPDIAARDIYICGPDGFMAAVTYAALLLAVRPDQIHQESFGF